MMSIKSHLFFSIKSFVILGIFFSWALGNAQQKNKKKFVPGEVWLDNKKQPINAHGGGFLLHKGTYYWFGEHKSNGEGGHLAKVGVTVYASKNLYNWKYRGVALSVVEDTLSKLQKKCVIERPKVLYNAKTKKFVMWFHHELKDQAYKAALTGVAVSDHILGPYQYINSFRIHAGILPLNMSEETFNQIPDINETQKLSRAIRIEQAKNGEIFKRDFLGGQMSRDMTLYLDDDGTAYHITASEENQTLLISKLSDDFLSLTGEYIRILAGERNEAPALFKYQNNYYMITSDLTGWKPNPARLSVATSLMGDWKAIGNPCEGTEEEKNTTFWSQSTYILPVKNKKNAFIFMADRWNDKNLADSRYVWLPIKFKQNVPYINWFSAWDLSVFR